MKVIFNGRGMGKTTKAIKMANETGGYLLVHSYDEAVRLSRLPGDQKPLRFPVTYQEFLSGKMRGSFVRNVVIDNAEMFLREVTGGVSVDAITLTTEETPDKEYKEYLDQMEVKDE